MKRAAMLLCLTLLACSPTSADREGTTPEGAEVEVIEDRHDEVASFTSWAEAEVEVERSDDWERQDLITAGVVALQPWYEARPRDAARIARIIDEAATSNGIDPWLAVAIARRESSLLQGQVGSLGEQGMFQVMPRSAALRVCRRGCSIDQPRCNAEVAMCFLAHVREICGSDDTWVWVGAYGMSRCPTPREARSMVSTRRARAFLVDLVGEERAAESWPL